MKVEQFIVLFFAVLLTFTSCSTGPDFERSNNNDPKSTAFTPDIRSLNAILNNDKTVSLTWVDDSSFEDGFIVGKQFGENGPLSLLDTLPANTANYTDNTEQLDLQTTYFVAPFKEETNSEDSLSFISARLRFGEFTEITSETSEVNKITINWDTDIPYADHFIIKKETALRNDFVAIDTIEGNKFSYSYTETEEVFIVGFSVHAILQNMEGEYQEIENIYASDIPINLPTNLQVDVRDEETITIDWQDNTDFDEQFVVYQRDPKNQFHAGDGPYQAIDTLNNKDTIKINYQPGIFYEFNIAPYKDGRIGSTINPVIVTLNTAWPEFTQIESISQNEIKLQWKDNNIDYPSEFRYPTKRFVIERKINDDDFEHYRTVDDQVTSLTIDDMDPALNYTFRIRSLSSRYSQTQLAYALAIVEDHSFNINSWDSPRTLRSTPLGTYFVYEYSHSAGSYGLKLLDPETGDEAEHLYFDSDFRGFSFSPDEKYVAIFQGSKPGVYDWKESYDAPIYSYAETEAEGVFINNDELIIRTQEELSDRLINTLQRIYVAENTIVNIPAFGDIQSENPDFYIFEMFPYKTESSLFLSTSLGAFAYNFIEDSLIDLNQDSYRITDANKEGEILMVKDDDLIIMLSEKGEVLSEFKKPDSINDYYLNFISAKFVFGNYVVIGTTQGMLLLFNKTNGEYLSYHHINNGTEKIYADTRYIAVSADGEKLLVILRNNNGLSKYFTSSEGWTTVSYEL